MRARPGRDGRRWTRVEGFPPGPITSLPVVTGVEQSLVLMRTRRHSVTFRSRHNRSSMAAVHRSRSRRSRMPGLAWLLTVALPGDDGVVVVDDDRGVERPRP